MSSRTTSSSFRKKTTTAQSPTTLEAHELTEGRSYYILLTTSSGLYRYDIRDVVQCTGFVGTTPLLRFLHKGAHVSNVTGEKLAESQVVECVGAGLSELGTSLQRFTMTPVWGEPPGYCLYLDESDVVSPQFAADLSRIAERELQQANVEYRDKRSSRPPGAARLQHSARSLLGRVHPSTRPGGQAAVSSSSNCHA